MNFLYVSEIPHPVPGGASRCIHTLFKALVKLGYRCWTVSLANEERAFDLDGVTCVHTSQPKLWAEHIFKHNSPSILLTQLAGADWASDMAISFGVPTILRIPSFEHFCSEPTLLTSCGRVCAHGGTCIHRSDYSRLFRNVTAVIGCSQFVVEACLEFYGCKAELIYPFIDPTDHVVPSTGDRVTLVWGTSLKGLDTFLQIARIHPEFKYLIVGSFLSGTDLNGLDVSVHNTVEDMHPIWQLTRILLAPSVVEAFGRVCVEAALNGIPVVASNRGGLLEAVGQEYCFPLEDTTSWSNEVYRLMTDSDYYHQRSRFALEQAKKFDLIAQVNRFLRVVDNCLGKRQKVRLSVLTSLYNSTPYLRGYFDDLARQTFQNFEVVLICNDPTDEERIIINSNNSLFVIRTVTVSRESTAASLNRALDIAEGEYITIAAVDDKHIPDAFQRHIEALDTHPEVSLVYGDYVAKNEKGEIVYTHIAPEFSLEVLKRQCYIGPHPTFRWSVVERVGKFDVNYPSASDYEFFLRLTSEGFKFLHISCLSEYLARGDSITYSDLGNMSLETKKIQEMYASC
jgi:glycosyltransferase involved in cell wall biosynthesis